MEAIEDQLGEFGSSADAATRAGDGIRPGSRACQPTYFRTYDGVTRPGQAGHLRAVPDAFTGGEHQATPWEPVRIPEYGAQNELMAPSMASVVPEHRSAQPLNLRIIGDLLTAAGVAAPEVLAVASYVEASVFAGHVEDLARRVEYLQLLAAGAVDRTRTEAVTAAAAARSSRSRAWVTGWDNGAETLNETDANWPGPEASGSDPAAASAARANRS